MQSREYTEALASVWSKENEDICMYSHAMYVSTCISIELYIVTQLESTAAI